MNRFRILAAAVVLVATMFFTPAFPARVSAAEPPTVAAAHLENTCRALGRALEEARAAARAGGLPVDWPSMLNDLEYVGRNVCLIARPVRAKTRRAYEARPDRRALKDGLNEIFD